MPHKQRCKYMSHKQRYKHILRKQRYKHMSQTQRRILQAVLIMCVLGTKIYKTHTAEIRIGIVVKRSYFKIMLIALVQRAYRVT